MLEPSQRVQCHRLSVLPVYSGVGCFINTCPGLSTLSQAALKCDALYLAFITDTVKFVCDRSHLNILPTSYCDTSSWACPLRKKNHLSCNLKIMNGMLNTTIICENVFFWGWTVYWTK